MLAGRDPGQLLIRQTVEVDRGERPADLDALLIFVRSQGLQEENEKDHVRVIFDPTKEPPHPAIWVTLV